MANTLSVSGDLLQSLKSSAGSEKCSVYLFPMANNKDLAVRNIELNKGHSRSASHSGVESTISPSFAGRPSALKKGHQRAFSQGQIIDSNELLLSNYHVRAPSKTDFILPVGHRESDSEYNLFDKHKGHSRQASRSESVYTLRHTTPPSNWKQYLCFFSREKQAFVEDSRSRTIVPNHFRCSTNNQKNRPCQNNRICTTKYTFLSFLPKNLLEQFHRVANLYFIFIVLLNWFPSINAFGKEVAMIPVLFVLGVTALKDLFEDRRRHASDKRINNSTCDVYIGEEECFKKVLWQNVKPGDIIRLQNNEVIPADILVLKCSDPHGLCYIDTCNLDGESNLKQRQVASCFMNKHRTFSPALFRSVVEVESPTTKIYRFHGAIVHPGGEKVPVCTENLLLRECILKNTDYVEGIVVYAGHETKAMLNNNGPRYKRSSLEKQMNGDIMWCVIILLVLCMIGSIGSYVWLSSFTIPYNNIPFLLNDESSKFETLLTFCTFIIILQVMIPLSLYVTIEMTKLLQVYLIHNNSKLFDTLTNKRIECRALNITEELGQVQYIFSDKTGTLTENKMLFRRCTIAGVDYNHPALVMNMQTKTECTPLNLNQKLQEDLANADLSDISPDENDAAFFPSNLNLVSKPNIVHSKRVQEFMLVLALCNTVVISTHSHKNELTCEDDTPDSTSKEMVLTADLSDTTAFVPAPTAFANFSNAMQTSSIPSSIRESFQLKNSQRKLVKRKTSVFRNFIVSANKSPETTDNSLQEFCLSNDELISRMPQKFSNATGTSSSESSPTSTSLRQRISTLENFGKNTFLKPKFLNMPSMLISSANRRWGANKNGVSKSKVKSSDVVKPIFEAESPDELALVETAYCYNVRLIKRSPALATVFMPGNNVLEFDVLKVLPFDSTRKCMSIILRNPITKEITVFSKGADSVIMPLLPATNNPEMQKIIYQTHQHLNTYSKQGLRILVMAKRVLSEKEYSDWAKRNLEAELSLHDREKKLMKSYSEVEKNFTLLGATGIEDRLQEGVPETINAMRAAGIVIWVLTGDKPETAINVAYSSKLFSAEMEIIKLAARSKDAAENMISFYLKEIENSSLLHLQDESADSGTSSKSDLGLLSFVPLLNKRKSKGIPFLERSSSRINQKQRALVVDGKTLTFILDRRSNLQVPFLRLTRYCTSVLCCRSTPLQKAYIVRVVKEKLHMRTLAIGNRGMWHAIENLSSLVASKDPSTFIKRDGANDVSMIQAADVGIGISGQEGMQAVMASDFALSRFKFLERFLIVHGHWSYDRLANMVLYFFYKNAIFVFLIFWYQSFCGFSGAVMIDQIYLMLYNLFFTSLPPLVIGVYDQDAPEELLLANPSLYSKGRRGSVYRSYLFWFTIMDALYQSLVIFYFTFWHYDNTDIGIWEFGMSVVTCCMFTMLLQGCLETRSWTIIHFMSLFISLGSFYAFTFLYNAVCFQCIGFPSNTWVLQNTLGTCSYWLLILISTVLALMPRLIFYSIKNSIMPNDVTRTVIESRRAAYRKENFLVSWSRSASASSVYRASEMIGKEKKPGILTAIG